MITFKIRQDEFQKEDVLNKRSHSRSIIAILSMTLLAFACSERLITPAAAAELRPRTSGKSLTKTFTPEQLKLPGKKGACFTLRDPESKQGGSWKENLPLVEKLDVSWNYSWGTKLIAQQPEDIEFIPMVWSARDKNTMEANLRETVRTHIKKGKIRRLLGFNEPDHKEQANMSYTTALKLWPTMEKMGVPLASPSCANAEGINDDSAQGVPGTWMRDFMTAVDKQGLRVDYIGVHDYGGGNFNNFKAKMLRIYEKYGKRPLLITEFAVADWKAKSPAENHHSPDKVLAFMKEAIPWIESQDWIAGYAWFSFDTDSPVGTSSALFDKKGNLTACGRYYKSVTPDNPAGDQTIQPDPPHSK